VTYVIIGACCNDGACVDVCPVNCIHPAPDEPGYATTEMLYVDPDTCIDCGACVDECPVDAIVPDYELEPADEPFLALNAAWFTAPEHRDYTSLQHHLPPLVIEREAPLKVAVIGSGPSAAYVVEWLLATRGLHTEVTVFEKLPLAGGLVRYGVAPDHEATKVVMDDYARTLRRGGVTARFETEVGVDVTIEQLRAEFDAIVVATGAVEGKPLSVPGADLPGVFTAADIVGWYNGHPQHADHQPDLSGERAVVIGNGNVALDVARVLLAEPGALRGTSISPSALTVLEAGNIREVVIVARRGIEHAAFTAGELIGLTQRDLAVSAPADELVAPDGDPIVAYKAELLGQSLNASSDRRVTFRFGWTPTEVHGDGAAQRVRFTSTYGAGELEVEAGLVVAAIGYRPAEVPGVPYDDLRSLVPNELGRVLDTSGVYVAGWAKRGPSGGIGTNRWDARETVSTLLQDLSV